jgi:flagellar hook assembly protein FlgD
MGRLVKTLVDEKQDAGYHTVKWHGIDDNGKQVPSGIYVYRLETTDGYEETRKMILLK